MVEERRRDRVEGKEGWVMERGELHHLLATYLLATLSLLVTFPCNFALPYIFIFLSMQLPSCNLATLLRLMPPPPPPPCILISALHCSSSSFKTPLTNALLHRQFRRCRKNTLENTWNTHTWIKKNPNTGHTITCRHKHKTWNIKKKHTHYPLYNSGHVTWDTPGHDKRTPGKTPETATSHLA